MFTLNDQEEGEQLPSIDVDEIKNIIRAWLEVFVTTLCEVDFGTFEVICDKSNNSDETIEAHELHVDIYLYPPLGDDE